MGNNKIKKADPEAINSHTISMSDGLYKRYVNQLKKHGMSFSKRVRTLIESDLEQLKTK